MKITKTPDDIKKFEYRKQVANEGCNKCPCCGETRSFNYHSGKVTGIDSPVCTIRCKGFFNIKFYKIDKYKCFTCGAEWESEPYLTCEDKGM